MKRKTFNKILKIFFILIVLSFLGGIFYLYFNTGFFTIHNYEIIGVKNEYISTLQKKFELLDKQKLYKVLPGNRVISYHSKDIKSVIREVLPNTATVSILPISFHTLRISVTTYTPLFKTGDHQAITKDAIIYTEMRDINELPLFTFATSSNITPQILSQVSDIITKVSATIFPVQLINVNEYSDIYLRKTDNGSAVILSATSDIKKVWSNLVSAIDTEPLKSKLETEKDRLEYLDTRFGNKVFYKFTNDNKTSIIGNYATTTSSTTTLSR